MNHVLLIEDSEAHYRLIRALLRQLDPPLTEVEWQQDLHSGLQAIREQRADVVLLDLSLPDSPIDKTLEAVVAERGKLPIVVLTSLNDMESATASVAQGADDFVVKGEATAELLHRAMRYAIERRRSAEALRERTEELERSNDSLKHFAYTIAHELRQPLNRTSLNIGLSRMKLENDELCVEAVLEPLGVAEQAVDRMATMVTELLEFARMDGEGFQLQVVELSKLTRRVLRGLGDELKACGAKVDVWPLPRARCNPRFLWHVLHNLVTNAIRFRGAEPLRITISAEEQGDEVCVSVQDNGQGIAPEDRERIFGMFVRGSGTQQVEGTGIGLALSRRILAHHGGGLTVDSEPGRGATFRFTLPAALKSGESVEAPQVEGQRAPEAHRR